MATSETLPLGAPCWIDLGSSQPEKAKDFYASMFGWVAEQAGEEFGNYVTFTKDSESVAGMMRNDASSGIPDSWSTYLKSANAAETARAALQHGGEALTEPIDIPGVGAMAFVSDAGGAAIGTWQPGGHPGFAAHGRPGTAVWHELQTRDYAAVVKFYQDVFGWETQVASDEEDFRYTLQVVDGQQYAGIMDGSGFLPAGSPAQWGIYFGVEEAAEACSLAEELGGSVVRPPEDTPFGILATLSDSTGTPFKIRQETAVS